MKIITLVVFLCISFGLRAQTQPTREETIKYINDNLDAVGGQYRMLEAESKVMSKYVYSYARLATAGQSLSFDYSRYLTVGHDYHFLEATQRFLPEKIVSITISSNTGKYPVGLMILKLAVKTGALYESSTLSYRTPSGRKEEKQPASEELTDEIYIHFLQADPENFEKLKKAFYHLRDLAKAGKKDFFAN